MPRKHRIPLFSTLQDVASDPEGKILLGSAISAVLVGTVVYMFLEDWYWLDALYFSVVTLATVGFGDLHPTTNEAKLFTVFYIIFGVGIIAGFVSEVARRRREQAPATPVLDGIERVEEDVETRRDRRRQAAASDVAPEAEAASGAAGPDRSGPTAV
jgi:hypothetical protein